MKVFVFGIWGFPWIGGGAEKHSEELYPRLVNLGHDVTILTRTLYFPSYLGVKFKKIPYLNRSWSEVMSHSILCSLYCLWKKPDVVHIHNMGACLLVPLLMVRGIKVILTIHSLNYLHKKWGHVARFVLNLCEGIGINFSHKIILVSKDLVKFLRDKYHRKMYLAFIPNGVNKAITVPPGLVLKKYDLEPKKYVLAIGRLTPEKEFPKLIQAFKSIKRPDFKLVIVGNSVHKTEYSKRLLLNRSVNIVFTGFQCGKDLHELFSNAGIFVSASSIEGFPLVILEALSYGLPVLASNIPPHREMKLPHGRYFDGVGELALKIDKLMEEGNTEEERENFKNILIEKYNWEAITKQVGVIYEG